MLGLKLPEGSAGRPAVLVQHREALLDATGAAAVVVTLDREGTVLLPAVRRDAPDLGETRRGEAGVRGGGHLRGRADPGPGRGAAADHERGLLPRRRQTLQSTGPEPRSAAPQTLAATWRASPTPPSTRRNLPGTSHATGRRGRRLCSPTAASMCCTAGHTRYLNQAKQLGDILVVALNSDDSVRRLKGPERPINTVADRAAVIAALSCVDYVTVFDTATPIPLIEELTARDLCQGRRLQPGNAGRNQRGGTLRRHGGDPGLRGGTVHHRRGATHPRRRRRRPRRGMMRSVACRSAPPVPAWPAAQSRAQLPGPLGLAGAVGALGSLGFVEVGLKLTGNVSRRADPWRPRHRRAGSGPPPELPSSGAPESAAGAGQACASPEPSGLDCSRIISMLSNSPE